MMPLAAQQFQVSPEPVCQKGALLDQDWPIRHDNDWQEVLIGKIRHNNAKQFAERTFGQYC